MQVLQAAQQQQQGIRLSVSLVGQALQCRQRRIQAFIPALALAAITGGDAAGIGVGWADAGAGVGHGAVRIRSRIRVVESRDMVRGIRVLHR